MFRLLFETPTFSNSISYIYIQSTKNWNDWKCHFSSFPGMIGMTQEWWFDAFNAHSYHSCHSWFFCAIPSFQPHSAIQNSFQNDEQWGKWGMTSNEWPKLTTRWRACIDFWSIFFKQNFDFLICIKLHLFFFCFGTVVFTILPFSEICNVIPYFNETWNHAILKIVSKNSQS